MRALLATILVTVFGSYRKRPSEDHHVRVARLTAMRARFERIEATDKRSLAWEAYRRAGERLREAQ
jgi:hypothetical protein